MRDRMRRRKKKGEAGVAGEQEQPQSPQADALQPTYPDSSEERAADDTPDMQNADLAAYGEAGNQDESGGATAVSPPQHAKSGRAGDPVLRDAQAGGRRSRSRSRRRKRKPTQTPAAQPRPRSETPLQPAYGETTGPRPPIPAPFVPGGPTGEAAELGVTGEEEPPAPAREPAAPAKRPAKGAVILSVGLPGSGKTTWFKRHGVTPLSSDLLRSLLFDDPTEQRHQDLVFSSLRSLLRARLMARMPQNYVDATNLSPKERRHWIRMARDFGYEVHAVYFDVPLETCMDRNQRRQRVVPEDVMHRMAAKLRPPAFEEGFSKIIVVRVKQKPPEEAAGE